MSLTITRMYKRLTTGLLFFILFISSQSAEKIRDHEVVLDSTGRLLPWTSYDRIIRSTMNFIKSCPTHQTRFGQDPWYLITGRFSAEGTFQ
jgi:hypothetical protein